MKQTKQRKEILSIVNNSCDHLDAYSIYNEAKKVIPNISLGTVYRNLHDLCEIELIKSLKVGDVVWYDRNTKHHHFVCDKCHKIYDIFDLQWPKIENLSGNKITDYEILFKGICKDCQKEEK